MKKWISVLMVSAMMSISGEQNINAIAKPPKNDPPKEERQTKGEVQQKGGGYSLEQAISDNAQLSTIAFSGLAFITGNIGADTFMPPGKVADFFGFQYMRDVDEAGYGHNTQFLTRAANNILYILNDEQKQKLVALAKKQAPLYISFSYNRLPMIKAFRESLEGRQGLSKENVAKYTAELYKIDADLSYNRAVVVGEIINSLTKEQIEYLSKMKFNDFNTWPDVEENQELKRSMSNPEFVAVMTYASEMFSWYKGSIDADVYFCPERHGTYFGGFFMKDYPAMHNPDYFISTSLTGDKGKMFLEILDEKQRAVIEGIIPEQKNIMNEIVDIRRSVSEELRKSHIGQVINKEKIYSLIERYGYLDGELSALYTQRFSDVNKTLTTKQKEKLTELRDLKVVPKGAYMFSTEVSMPEIPNIDFMFGVGNIPEDAAKYQVPAGFSQFQGNEKNDKPKKNETEPEKQKPPKK